MQGRVDLYNSNNNHNNDADEDSNVNQTSCHSIRVNKLKIENNIQMNSDI